VSGRVAVIVLAAGGSRRLGRPKQLEPHGDTTLLAHAVATALDASLGPVVVVLGAEAELCRAALVGHAIAERVRVAVNPSWEAGLASSIVAGLTEVEALDPPCEAVLLTTCDQPLVNAAHLRALPAAMRGSARPMAASGYAGTIGVPAAFARDTWSDLRTLESDQGAKQVLQRRPDLVAVVPCPGAAVDVDADPPAT
jgi:molybdenum cofactor cytidylyltransferase